MKKEIQGEEKPASPAETSADKKDISATQLTEPVFICDECGDTMWEAVLAQEVLSNPPGNACPVPLSVPNK